MSNSEPDIEEVMRTLEALGVIRRWWCDRCQDHVPYRCLEMSERASRLSHGRAKHVTPDNEDG